MALFVNVWLERNSCDSLSLIVIKLYCTITTDRSVICHEGS